MWPWKRPKPKRLKRPKHVKLSVLGWMWTHWGLAKPTNASKQGKRWTRCVCCVVVPRCTGSTRCTRCTVQQQQQQQRLNSAVVNHKPESKSKSDLKCLSSVYVQLRLILRLFSLFCPPPPPPNSFCIIFISLSASNALAQLSDLHYRVDSP